VAGLERGDGGGLLVAQGTPEELAKSGTFTGDYLEEILTKNSTPLSRELNSQLKGEKSMD